MESPEKPGQRSLDELNVTPSENHIQEMSRAINRVSGAKSRKQRRAVVAEIVKAAVGRGWGLTDITRQS
jgi:hypothetical protein